MNRSPVVCIAIIIYQPDPAFIDRLHALLQNDVDIILVNNGVPRAVHDALVSMRDHGRIHIIENNFNMGVAEGLNQTMLHAEGLGVEWVLTLDQDSEPGDGMLLKMIEVLNEVGLSDDLAILAPQIIEVGSGKRMRYLHKRTGLFFERVDCAPGSILKNISMALSSGSLIRLQFAREVDYFRSDFFIDYVDTEFCLRVLSQGYEIAVACDAQLFHRLGDREQHTVGQLTFHPTFHNPIRWYYISRNRIPMLRMYALKFPHWFAFELISSAYIFFRMLIFEDSRWKKILALMYGTWDGIRRQMGPIRNEIEAKLALE